MVFNLYFKKKRLLPLTLALLVAMLLNLGLPSARLWAQGGEKPKPDASNFPDGVQIVGGDPADPGEWPWQVRLELGGGFCGGSLIHPRWVLTASHCVPDDVALEDITVFLGEHDINVNEGTEQIRGVVQIVRNPGFFPPSFNDDVALLKLDTPAMLNERVAIIPFATNAEKNPDVLATITGWGALEEGAQTTPDVLYEVSVPIVSNETCQPTLNSELTDGMFCAGYEAGGKDSCQGDSGGPLVVSTNEGWKLAGVVSFGIGCARPNEYGVYAHVPYYTNWIRGVISSATGPEPIINTGFEQGSNHGWREQSLQNYRLIVTKDLPVPPRTGSFIVWLGGVNGESARVRQNFILGERAKELQFYYRISSNENECNFDLAGVALGNNVVQTFGLCQENVSSEWQLGTIDISEYAGRTIELDFRSVTDGSAVSSFYVDDVSIISEAPVQPAVTSISPTWGEVGDMITINGTSLLDTTKILFNGKPATYTVESDTQLIAIVPAGSASGPVEVQTSYAQIKSPTNFTFAPLLSVTVIGSGEGAITSIPAEINCPITCTNGIEPGKEVTLTATAEPLSSFLGWAGDCSGTALTCVVPANQAKNVVAAFTLDVDDPAYLLTVKRIGEGTVTSIPAGVDCGITCTAVLTAGSQVTLTAVSSSQIFTFESWSGVCTGTETTCGVTLDSTSAVTATFAANSGLMLPRLRR